MWKLIGEGNKFIGTTYKNDKLPKIDKEYIKDKIFIDSII